MATFDHLADLPIAIDGYTLEPLDGAVVLGPESRRRCTLVRISGDGHTGVGEDVVYGAEEHDAFEQAGPVHDLKGPATLGEFCELTEQLDLFPERPTMEASLRYRVWAFHSAALDLALRQAGLTLHAALGREPRPLRYVASTRLGEPPSLEPVSRRLALDPTLHFKLDATSSWTPELFAQLAATGAVDVIDLKGLYRGSIVDQGADPVLYRRVAETFPEAWIEDPDLSDPAAAAALADVHDRITWDANIHSIADIQSLPFVPRMVNLKPSRIGSLRDLCDTYDHCAACGIGTYSGGQTELGTGRGQAQYLAAVFHPDTPNDLAPILYNRADPPAGLPRSPLTASFDEPGFRWPGD